MNYTLKNGNIESYNESKSYTFPNILRSLSIGQIRMRKELARLL